MFDLYRIDEIEIEWYPEYTVLSDGGVTSPAVNVQLNTAIDPAGNTPTAVTDVLQYRTLHATGISKLHKRRFVPSYLLDGISPCKCYISCASPSSNFWGIAYGVSPTGTAMTFRSRARFFPKPGTISIKRDTARARPNIGRVRARHRSCQNDQENAS